MKLLKFKILLFLFLSLITVTCSHNPSTFRTLSSQQTSGIERLKYLLAIDRLQYYLTELSEFKKGKVGDEVLLSLNKLTAEKLIAMNLTLEQINDPMKYDDLILSLVKKMNPEIQISAQDINWGYNFFKKKLRDSFLIVENEKNSSSVDIGYASKKIVQKVPEILDIQQQTLHSSHYISNRTTQAIFKEALGSHRTIEFHLSDPREFEQSVAFREGKVIGEIKTLSRNYNKIFLVQYPNENTFRIAITNIGGGDRLEHLLHSLSLSKDNIHEIQNKVAFFGDIENFHLFMQKRLENIIDHLPKADRVIIGQKASFEKHFQIIWKLKALKNLYSVEPQRFTQKIDSKNLIQLEKLFSNMAQFDIDDDKRVIEGSYDVFESYFKKERSDLLPEQFKQFEFNNFIVSMSDIIFINSKGKMVRWRLLSNVWGDEITPIAKALINTGNEKVIYSGTAGALPGRGLKVGDMVVPTQIDLGNNQYTQISGANLHFNGLKRDATLGHVGSPFEETQAWLKESLAKGIDLVEVEGRYLARAYDSQNLGMYLIVSDIIGSEGETLANASSSKRKANLRQFIGKVLEQDFALSIEPPSRANNEFIERVREVVLKALKGKGSVYQYHLISHFVEKNEIPSEAEVLAEASSRKAFSDKFFLKRMTDISNILIKIYSKWENKPDMLVPRNFLQGNYNPRSDKLVINPLALSDESLQIYVKTIEQFQEELNEMSDFFEVTPVRDIPLQGSGLIQVGAPKQYDSDLMFRLFTHYSLMRVGLDYQVTSKANVTFSFLPTNKLSNICDIAAKDFCYASYFSPSEMTRALGNNLQKVIGGINLESILDQYIQDINQHFIKTQNRNPWMAKVEKRIVSELPAGSLARIVPDISQTEGLIIRLEMTQEGLKRPEVIIEEIGHLQQITFAIGFYKHPLFWASVSLDAKAGSARAKRVLAAAERDVIKNMKVLAQQYGINETYFSPYLEARAHDADQLVNAVEKEVKKENRLRNKMGNSWKAMQEKLQNEKLKLDDYIAQNDRAKVASLVETFLPWEQMEPSEINAWRNWLVAMARPMKDVPNSQKLVMFRGLGGDLIRESNNGGHFLMSPMLTKNQGNYTRRLRSLKTYRDKLADLLNGAIPGGHINSITSSFKGHAYTPQGSPFLSVSEALIAWDFSGQERTIATIYTSRERLVDNFAATINEGERLMPLIVFPDEIISIDSNKRYEEVEAQAVKKIGRPLIPGVETELIKQNVDPLQATLQYWNYINTKPGLYIPPNGSCADMLEKVFINQ